jgi:hypothetical protein
MSESDQRGPPVQGSEWRERAKRAAEQEILRNKPAQPIFTKAGGHRMTPPTFFSVATIALQAIGMGLQAFGQEEPKDNIVDKHRVARLRAAQSRASNRRIKRRSAVGDIVRGYTARSMKAQERERRSSLRRRAIGASQTRSAITTRDRATSRKASRAASSTMRGRLLANSDTSGQMQSTTSAKTREFEADDDSRR